MIAITPVESRHVFCQCNPHVPAYHDFFRVEILPHVVILKCEKCGKNYELAFGPLSDLDLYIKTGAVSA